MKRLITATIALLAALSAQAVTLSPVTLLNPVGSTAGQAIVSTGPTTAPAWSKVTATALAAQAANTVVANVTGSSASPTAFAMPSCSTANSALQYTSGTGFTCVTNSALTTGTLAQFAATTSAQLAGVISDETGSGALVFGTNPTISGTASVAALTASGLITPSSTVGIKGTATNDSAQAGSIGEYVSSVVGATGLTAGTPTNLTSISLTAGDWDVTGSARFSPAGSTTVSTVSVAVNTTSATLGGPGTTTTFAGSLTTGQPQIMNAPLLRLSLASTTTIYLVVNAGFAVSTLTSDGIIRARRVR